MSKTGKTIADELRRAIRAAEKAGKTRYAIAKAGGLAQSQVDRIASGETVPTLPVAERLALGIGYKLALVPIIAK